MVFFYIGRDAYLDFCSVWAGLKLSRDLGSLSCQMRLRLVESIFMKLEKAFSRLTVCKKLQSAASETASKNGPYASVPGGFVDKVLFRNGLGGLPAREKPIKNRYFGGPLGVSFGISSGQNGVSLQRRSLFLSGILFL